jgi:hypothetical protein
MGSWKQERRGQGSVCNWAHRPFSRPGLNFEDFRLRSSLLWFWLGLCSAESNTGHHWFSLKKRRRKK